MGYGTRGPAVLSMGGGPLRAGSYARLRLQRLRPGAATLLVLSDRFQPTVYQGSVYVTNPHTAVYPFIANGQGVVEIPGITGGGGATTMYVQFGYADGSRLGISNALEARFLN